MLLAIKVNHLDSGFLFLFPATVSSSLIGCKGDIGKSVKEEMSFTEAGHVQGEVGSLGV